MHVGACVGLHLCICNVTCVIMCVLFKYVCTHGLYLSLCLYVSISHYSTSKGDQISNKKAASLEKQLQELREWYWKEIAPVRGILVQEVWSRGPIFHENNVPPGPKFLWNFSLWNLGPPCKTHQLDCLLACSILAVRALHGRAMRTIKCNP